MQRLPFIVYGFPLARILPSHSINFTSSPEHHIVFLSWPHQSVSHHRNYLFCSISFVTPLAFDSFVVGNSHAMSIYHPGISHNSVQFRASMNLFYIICRYLHLEGTFAVLIPEGNTRIYTLHCVTSNVIITILTIYATFMKLQQTTSQNLIDYA